MSIKTQKISVVIPARNEAMTINKVVGIIKRHPKVDEVIVVDNGSSDDTSIYAQKNGAKTVYCEEIGVGHAMKVGIRASRNRYILRTDADIDNWQLDWIDLLLPVAPHCLHRGIYRSPYNQLPISNYVVRPFFHLYMRDWEEIPIPTTGTYLFDRTDYDWSKMPNNWAIDVAILVNALSTYPKKIKNINIGTLSDKKRSVEHYIPMATELNEFLTIFFIDSIKNKNQHKNNKSGCTLG
jgi:glycosyltransferase involved in cell wall biosynthesis